MLQAYRHWTMAAAAAALAACGGSSTTSAVATSTARGTLAQSPPLRVASLDAATLLARLGAGSSGQQLLQLAGNPTCGVDFYYIEFWTADPAGEPTESSGALMVPTGAAPDCSGPRPMLLYAHGTQTDRTYNIADISNSNNTEGALVAAMFAADGYIVIAPNYAGYDISTLGYHPFLDATQQSGEMIDALTAARAALPSTFAASTTDNGQLFITGYSEGGFVAMATQRAIEAAGGTVTAAAPMSGPYALEAFGDVIFYGRVDLGSTVFAPLLTTSYQHEYGDIYTTTADVYSPAYAPGIDTLLPTTVGVGNLHATGKLPETALFDSSTPMVTVAGNPTLSAQLTATLAVPSDPSDPDTPLYAAGFGSPGLINNGFRASYAIDAATDPDGAAPTAGSYGLAAAVPQVGLRRAFYLNDMRYGDWAPSHPMLLCGGDQDPTVFYSVNTGTMASFWSGLPAGLLTVLDVGATPSGPFASLQSAFQTAEAAQLVYYESPLGGSLSAADAQLQLLQSYHVDVGPFCALAARTFFSQF